MKRAQVPHAGEATVACTKPTQRVRIQIPLSTHILGATTRASVSLTALFFYIDIFDDQAYRSGALEGTFKNDTAPPKSVDQVQEKG
jgi:hypothetical protein